MNATPAPPKLESKEARPLTPPLKGPSDSLQLVFRNKDGSCYIHPMHKKVLSVGRDPKNDIVLPDACISGFHCEIRSSGKSTFEIVDLESKNGTQVNGMKVDRLLINTGDTITWGTVVTAQIESTSQADVGRTTGVALPAEPKADDKAVQRDAELKKKIQEQEKRLAELTGKVSAAESELKGLKSTIQEATTKKEKAEADATQAMDDAKQAEADMKKAKDQLEFFTSRLQATKDEREKVDDECRQFRASIKGLEEQKRRLQMEIDRLEVQKDQKQSKPEPKVALETARVEVAAVAPSASTPVPSPAPAPVPAPSPTAPVPPVPSVTTS